MAYRSAPVVATIVGIVMGASALVKLIDSIRAERRLENIKSGFGDLIVTERA